MVLSSAQLLQSPPSFQLYGFPLCSTFTSLALHIGSRTNNLEINFITEPIGNLCFHRWSCYLPLSSYFNTQEIFVKTRRKSYSALSQLFNREIYEHIQIWRVSSKEQFMQFSTLFYTFLVPGMPASVGNTSFSEQNPHRILQRVTAGGFCNKPAVL